MVYQIVMEKGKFPQKIEVTGLGESVYSTLRLAILDGELRPGARVHDRQLSEMLGVSRTPVRDALYKLECYGLVERRARGGWIVANFDPQDVKEVFELRRILEPLGLKRLSRTWDKAIVQELSSAFNDFPDPLPSDLYREYLKRDHRFHKKLIECSQNSRVIQFYSVIGGQIDRVRHYLSYGHQGRVDASLIEHREICRAIASHDLEDATALLLRHLHKIEELMTTVAREHELERWTTKEDV